MNGVPMVGRKQFEPQVALERALRVFWTQGYRGTSIQDLEAATGVGRASIYSTFGDKEDLFLKALDLYIDQYGPPVREAFRIHADNSTRALRATFDAALTRMSDPDLPAGCLIAQSTSDLSSLGTRSQAVVAELLRNQISTIAAALDTDRRAGRLDDSADPGALAAFLAGTIHSLSLLHCSSVALDVLERVAAHALKTIPTSGRAERVSAG